MQPLKAIVRGGKLVLKDAATDLPEGTEVELTLVEPPLDDGTDDLDDEERAALHAALEESIQQYKRGETIDMETALAELRAHE